MHANVNLCTNIEIGCKKFFSRSDVTVHLNNRILNVFSWSELLCDGVIQWDEFFRAYDWLLHQGQDQEDHPILQLWVRGGGQTEDQYPNVFNNSSTSSRLSTGSPHTGVIPENVQQFYRAITKGKVDPQAEENLKHIPNCPHTQITIFSCTVWRKSTENVMWLGVKRIWVSTQNTVFDGRKKLHVFRVEKLLCKND